MENRAERIIRSMERIDRVFRTMDRVGRTMRHTDRQLPPELECIAKALDNRRQAGEVAHV